MKQHIHPDQSAARKTATLVSSYPRRLEAEKNEILFSLQGYLCVLMNVYLIFMVLFHLFHAVFIS